jgi:uncharacterized circularly permuted ATP-grasp superfamily protein/uncharacterized alpha-E superfamily protein
MSATVSTPLSGSRPAGLLDAYAPLEGRHDEFKTPTGEIRPMWQKLAEALAASPGNDLSRRGEQLRRLIQDNGITYNVYGDPENTARPWGMDLLPMLLEWREWEKLETALAQRARLFNLILQDLYGPQTLLEQRILPPALVLGNPAFLRPCHGFTPPQGVFVPVYAADLARAPNGQWWVLADRLDAPSGIGYALENRFLATRVLSDWFRDNRIARLTGFIQTLRESFEQMVARHADDSRIALLTPGPANETYFEHSFLARNLGFPLVEGGDLVVRNQRVFLKTLSGLQPVELILRRVDSDFCDPVELRADSLLGVPGLLQAVRAGNVTVANALGAGVLESPAIAPFLPALCRHLLGEKLKIPTLASWWCGQPRELNYVLEHLDSLILQPVFNQSAGERVIGPRLSTTERDHWRDRLRAEPGAWCAREWVALATTPVFEDGRITPRHFQMRALLAAKGADYHTMPGGLTRIPSESDDLSVSMQRGGRSKDTWVLLPPEVPLVADIGPPLAAPPKARRQTGDLPCRVADNLYWLGRYLERSEGQARALRLLAGVLFEEGIATDPAAVLPFFEIFALTDARHLLWAGDRSMLDIAAAEKHLCALVWDPAQPLSLAANAARLERAAYRVKERLSSDAWTLLGQLQLLKPRAPGAGGLDEAMGELGHTVGLLAAISGLMMENMTRGYGWRFLDLGRRIERGLNIARLLRNALARPGPPPPTLLHNLLVCCDSLMTHRRRYLTNLQLGPVLDLLALDEANPRGLAYQLQIIREHVEALPLAEGENAAGRPTARLALALFSAARMVDAQELARENAYGARPALDEFFGVVARDLGNLSDALAQTYFAKT